MRTLRVRLSPAADADLVDISHWLDEQGVAAWIIRGYLGRVKTRYLRIGRVPLGVALREEYGPGVRQAAFEHSATILYRVEAERVLILRILRRGRDVEGAVRS